MEDDIKQIKNLLTQFIEKYEIKTLKINTNITFSSRFNDDNPKEWKVEYKSTVNNIDINLTK